MDDFTGRVAVVTGGGTGMGHELVVQLAAEGCHVATCDVSPDAMVDTVARALEGAPTGTRVTSFEADVSDPAQLEAFRDHVVAAHETGHINLLFNNAGVSGGGSFINDPPEDWDRIFGICWGGVYHGTRIFLPLLLASDAGHIVNTSSINGFFASVGPNRAHTAYSAAKFAVKGFTEALRTDLRVNAPHVQASVVMPGHIGTSIVLNSMRAFGHDPKELTTEQVGRIREDMGRNGLDLSGASDEDVRNGMQMLADGFRDFAPTTAAQAVEIILSGVRANRWRILVGHDAEVLDAEVRADPEGAYDQEFWQKLQAQGIMGGFAAS